jgi:hypothetical protein
VEEGDAGGDPVDAAATTAAVSQDLGQSGAMAVDGSSAKSGVTSS